jgi:hypothetical protein
MLKLPINRAAALLLLSIFVVGGVFAAAPMWGQTILPQDIALATAPLIGVVVAAPAFAGLCALVRCRKCRYRLFWHAVARRNHRDGIGWFLTATQCPQCGQSGA